MPEAGTDQRHIAIVETHIPEGSSKNATGVVCDDKTGNCFAILLSSYQLDGSISPALGNLTSPATLKLNENHRTGRIPSELAKFPLFRILDLTNNNIFKPVSGFPSRSL
ncbi:hypothetical protein O6H91_02G137600 [Diphasiastrum complanatum]|uniref:Uncharacterized protein n=1 Tax=Diphasiastrum complanatum TaxID=34168 RepID=A0ACC2ELB5_DIPCM|nr:hypothetical protein O6H91_02G137600 [Diphasiastrum complanatum]